MSLASLSEVHRAVMLHLHGNDEYRRAQVKRIVKVLDESRLHFGAVLDLNDPRACEQLAYRILDGLFLSRDKQ